MDELLKALQAGNTELVDQLAKALFITDQGKYNWGQMNEFEYYAPCKIFQVRIKDSEGYFKGGINYNGENYYFG